MQLTRLLVESSEHRLHLATLERRGALLGEALRLGLPEIREYPLTSFYDRNAFIQLRRLVAHLREHRIGIVHTHDFYSNVFGMTAAALARVPVRVASRRNTGGVRTRAQRKAELAIFKLAHAVVANANAVRADLIAHGLNADKTSVIYNGLDLERLTPRPAHSRESMLASFQLPPGGQRRFVTILANLHNSVKDHPTFLRAARRVRAAMPDAAFVIAGEGALTDPMRALAAQYGLERDVFFIGHCGDAAELLAVSDVCVLSSRAEGFSNSILEYMAASRPVVATEVGGAKEAVVEGETGYLVLAGDHEAMAARVISLLADPENARLMGQRGRVKVEQEFSCAAQLHKTLELYERLLGARSRARQSSMEHP